ncbi:MAG: NADH-quinone oxidoreductase subunit C [Bacillota bacterium]
MSADTWELIKVEAGKYLETMKSLKKDGLDYLSDLTAVDFKDKGIIEVVVHLAAVNPGTDPKTSFGRHVRVKTEVERDRPSLDSVTPIWAGANWFEREVWDLFGVDFPGHPDLRRIMTPEGFTGHPLRKDFVDERPKRERVPQTR